MIDIDWETVLDPNVTLAVYSIVIEHCSNSYQH